MSCPLLPTYNDERWATITTQAEEDCVEWIGLNQPSLSSLNKLLDIGIGTSHCYKVLHSFFTEIHGITVMDNEIAQAIDMQYLEGIYRVRKANKHDTWDFVQQVDANYAVIIDVNLKMFTCCELHWLDYFRTLTYLLEPGGVIVSHTAGFGQYDSPVYKALTGKPVAIMGEALTLIELTQLAARHELSMRMYPSPRVQDHSIVVIRK